MIQIRNGSRSFPLVFILVFTLSSLAYSPANARGKRPPTPVVVAEATSMELAPLSWLSGTVFSDEAIVISAELEARLTWVAKPGTHVKKNAVIARLDDTFIRIEIDEARADIRSEEANLRFFTQEEKRLQRLAKRNNAAQTQLDKTQSEKAQSASVLARAKTRLARSEERLARTVITAPFPGVISKRHVNVGSWLSQSDEIVDLVNDQNLLVRAYMPIPYRTFLKHETFIQARLGREIKPAKLARIITAGDAESRLMEIHLQPPFPDMTVGQFIQIAVPSANPGSFLAVPRDALVVRSRETAVYTVNDEDTAMRIAINTGVASGQWIAVEGEINEGDRVVIRGGERLRPGQQVRILAPQN